MSATFADIFASLKPVLAAHKKSLAVQHDTPETYTLVTRSPSPFPQHKGEPLFFASVRVGKAYVSFHLMPLYMCPELNEGIPAGLKKRKQGKACFNFKSEPDAGTLAELGQVVKASLEAWRERKWL